MNDQARPVVEFPQCRCRAALVREEITPPVGMYHRMWGAATQDRSTGVHQPITATVMVLAPESAAATGSATAIFVALDHVLFWTVEMDQFLDHVSQTCGRDRNEIVVYFSHTHAAGLMGLERAELPGGEGIPDYLRTTAELVGRMIEAAFETLTPAAIVFGTGRCNLARNRDLYDPQRDGYVCGFNPDRDADDTVCVARITSSESGSTIGTIVNYACHPTTLAWDNSLISPDYVGAMRDVVEANTNPPVPCFFVQGASGDLGPREGFVGDAAVAERNGRQLGYAVLSALENLPPAGMTFAYSGAVLSGATIGTWEYEPVGEDRNRETARWQGRSSTVSLDYRSDLTNLDALRQQSDEWTKREADALSQGDSEAARAARAMIERCTRRLVRFEHIDASRPFEFPVRLWRFGDVIWVAVDGEPYSLLQQELRRRFPETTIVVGTLANGASAWYLLDEASYGKGLYQEEASILAAGSLERVIEHVADGISQLIDD